MSVFLSSTIDVLGLTFVSNTSGIYSVIDLPQDLYTLCNKCIFAKFNNDLKSLTNLPYSVFVLQDGSKLVFNELTGQVFINGGWNTMSTALCVVAINTLNQEVF